MRKSLGFFFWIVLMVLGLIAVLVITQVNTSQSLNRLLSGNNQAAGTFAINNRLEEIVNMSFELEAKMLSIRPGSLLRDQIKIEDSINQLGSKADSLDRIVDEAVISSSMDNILSFVNKQVNLTKAILHTVDNSALLDSMRKERLSDSIYAQALDLQTKLEKTLSLTLQENKKVAERVSWLNKLLAFTALIAVLILATIIVRRQVLQFILIRDLLQARKLALQSVKIKDQFLANMSHEIRTPLNAIKGFSSLLNETNLDKDQKQFAGIIHKSSESLLHIVNDILDLSKMESGALVIRNRPFKLIPLLKELEVTYATLAAEKKINFFLHLPAHFNDNLSGDPERLKQVLVNLIGNAIKFTKAGFVSLSLTVIGIRNEMLTVEFAVEDSGIGIPRDKQQQVFERFEQIDNSFLRMQGGTGLGLAISKTIVVAMGSEIKLNSEEGRGSVFSFCLNFPVLGEAIVKEEDFIKKYSTSITDPFKNKVLLAEDNPVNQLLISKLLEPYHPRIQFAGNGQEVMKELAENEFDVILMDVQMPVMDGITTSRLIREKWGNQIPIIGLTAYVQPNEIEKCFDAGMNDCIAKPIDEDQLYSILKKYIYLGNKSPFPASNDEAGALLDPGYLEKLCNGDPSCVNAILDELIKQIPFDIKAMQNSTLLKDKGSLGKNVHHARSTLSALGKNTQAYILLEQLDHTLHSGNNWDEIGKSVAILVDKLQETVQFLDHSRK